MARNRKKYSLKLFSIILDPALNQEVHLIQEYKPEEGGKNGKKLCGAILKGSSGSEGPGRGDGRPSCAGAS